MHMRRPTSIFYRNINPLIIWMVEQYYADSLQDFWGFGVIKVILRAESIGMIFKMDRCYISCHTQNTMVSCQVFIIHLLTLPFILFSNKVFERGIVCV